VKAYACAALALSLLAAGPAFAKSVTLETVDLTARGMSTEGGEAKLYRVTTSNGAYCRIQVIHYGETGKATYAFAFNPRLFSAVMRDYDYSQPIHAEGEIKVTLARSETLRTKNGSATLRAAFKEYRSFFDPRQLAKCSRR